LRNQGLFVFSGLARSGPLALLLPPASSIGPADQNVYRNIP